MGVFLRHLVPLIVLVSAVPSIALACSPPDLTLVGYPAHDESDVPTDAIPIYKDPTNSRRIGQQAIQEVSLIADGEQVPVSPRLTGDLIEFVPEGPLQPNAAHALRTQRPAQ